MDIDEIINTNTCKGAHSAYIYDTMYRYLIAIVNGPSLASVTTEAINYCDSDGDDPELGITFYPSSKGRNQVLGVYVDFECYEINDEGKRI